MTSNKPLLTAVLASLASALCTTAPARAQEPALRRDVPPAAARDCSAAGAAARVPETQDPREAARLVASAREAALLGDPRAARDLLARAARADSAAANVAFLHARTLEELGEVDAAVGEYCRYLRLAADAPDAEEVRQAVRRLAPPVRAGIPDSAVARFNAGLSLADSDRSMEAERAMSDVIAAAPSWSTPYYNRALLRLRSDRRAEARADLERFLALEPQGPDETRVRGWLAQLATPFRTYSPGAAFAYGLIPGAGYFYTGRPMLGTALLAAAGGAAAFGVLYQTRHVECLTVPQNNECPPAQVRSQHMERPYLIPAAGIAAAATILGALDAARGARRHNARAAAERIGSAVHIRPARIDVALVRLRF